VFKRGLAEVEMRLQHKIEWLRSDTTQQIAETNQPIAETKSDLTRWIISVGFLQHSLIIGVLLNAYAWCKYQTAVNR
jgi:hypothetical protein